MQSYRERLQVENLARVLRHPISWTSDNPTARQALRPTVLLHDLREKHMGQIINSVKKEMPAHKLSPMLRMNWQPASPQMVSRRDAAASCWGASAAQQLLNAIV